MPLQRDEDLSELLDLDLILGGGITIDPWARLQPGGIKLRRGDLRVAAASIDEFLKSATGAAPMALVSRPARELESLFLGNMSYELRVALNVIRGRAQLLLRGIGGALTSVQRMNLDRIDSSARHLLTLINGILALSRIDAGETPVRPSPVRLPKLVDEVLVALRAPIEESRLTVNASVSPRLPPLETDRRKVKRILTILVGSALKFTTRGSVHVRVSYSPRRQTLTTTVRYPADRISKVSQDKIFKDFEQLDVSLRHEYVGVGIGLAIAHRLTALLGGNLTLSSRGSGAALTVRLPRTKMVKRTPK